MEASTPEKFDSVFCKEPLELAVILPDVEVLTSEARSILPAHISLPDASAWASRLGRLITALNQGNLARVGELVMSDEHIEPRRAKLLVPYQDIKSSALLNGAYGCALSGSGPAMFAVCPSKKVAENVAKAMSSACRHKQISESTQIVQINAKGAYVV